MGQKSHPIGLRLGIHRKWGTSWCPLPAIGRAATVSSRGGMARSGREDRLSTLLTRLPFVFSAARASIRQTPNVNRTGGRSRRNANRRPATRFFPVDLQVRPGVGGSLSVLLSYSSLYSR